MILEFIVVVAFIVLLVVILSFIFNFGIVVDELLEENHMLRKRLGIEEFHPEPSRLTDCDDYGG